MAESHTDDDGEQNSQQFEAVDPSDLRVGDRVHVDDVAGEFVVRGEVTRLTCEWGRYTAEVDQEDGETVEVSEETGRTWTRIEEWSA